MVRQGLHLDLAAEMPVAAGMAQNSKHVRKEPCAVTESATSNARTAAPADTFTRPTTGDQWN
jgi:hypothetical protein